MRNLEPGKLSSALAENMRYLENVLNTVFNFDHDILSNIATDDHHVKYLDSEVDTIVAVHAAIAGEHHAKYTDGEVDTIVATHTAIAAAHHAKYLDSEVDTIVATHAAIAAAHHTKYTDAEVNALIATAGTWTTWVPTYNNFTIGAGTVVARYVELGDIVIAQFSLTFASDTTIDGSSPDVSLPVTANGSGFSVLPGTTAIAYESGSGLRFCTSYLKSTTTAAIFPQEIIAGYLQAATVSATIPFTWGTGDVYAFTIIYEKA